jgi:alcohol dehydrogenase class IV
MQEFRYTGYAQEIIFGPGPISHLREAIEPFGWRCLMLCSSGSLRRDGTTSSIEEALGDRLITAFEHVQLHVPDVQVAEALTLACENEIDALIGLGGGSPISDATQIKALLRAAW